MTREPFDLDRVRRNFDRARDPVPPAGADRLADARAPLDPWGEARRQLDVVRREVGVELPGREATVAPFVDRVAGLVERLEAASVAGEGAAKDDPAEIRAELVAALADLEDLCAALAGIG
jgi:hypothetical protein